MASPPTRYAPQLRIPATYMRGGTSKGVFFRLQDLPEAAQAPGAARDALLLRVIGSPDPYGKQIDGMGGATSSTSKAVIVSRSTRAGHDVDYLFGQVSIDSAFVDWSGNCGNLSAAVGPFAISAGLVDAARLPRDGMAVVRIWQANIGKTIVAHVPMAGGQVVEDGDFELDGVTFPAAEIQLEFLDPADEGEDGGAVFPTGHLVDTLDVPGVGALQATLINAGIPTIFVNAADIGYTGSELQEAINGNPVALARFEALRTIGALRMGLIRSPAEAEKRQHTPKIAFVAPPADYVSSSGKLVKATDIDLLARALENARLSEKDVKAVNTSDADIAADIYEASLGDLLTVIEPCLADAPQPSRLWLIGHNPALEQLVFHLDAAARLHALPTAGIVVLQFDGRAPATDPGAARIAHAWSP